VEYEVWVDPAFTAVERRELHACAAVWRSFSSDRVLVRFVDGAADFRLERRGPPNSGYVLRDRVAWIDADAAYRDGHDARAVRALCMNLVGAIFGAEWHHERGALSQNDVVPEFTDADRRSCLAANLCDPT